MINSWPAPPLYLGILLKSALLTWLLARLVVAAVGLAAPVAGGPLDPRSQVLLVGTVTLLTWLDLRRRSFWILLPTLGLSTRTALGVIALVATFGEVAVATFQ